MKNLTEKLKLLQKEVVAINEEESIKAFPETSAWLLGSDKDKEDKTAPTNKGDRTNYDRVRALLKYPVFREMIQARERLAQHLKDNKNTSRWANNLITKFNNVIERLLNSYLQSDHIEFHRELDEIKKLNLSNMVDQAIAEEPTDYNLEDDEEEMY